LRDFFRGVFGNGFFKVAVPVFGEVLWGDKFSPIAAKVGTTEKAKSIAAQLVSGIEIR
jgi:hypothetical protein